MTNERRQGPHISESEENTEEFRAAANDQMIKNEEYNRLRGLRSDDPSYRISSQAELAKALSNLTKRDVSRRMVQKILGGVHRDTDVKLVTNSAYIPMIRRLLDLVPVATISVRMPRASVMKFIAELPDADFKVFEDAVQQRMQRKR